MRTCEAGACAVTPAELAAPRGGLVCLTGTERTLKNSGRWEEGSWGNRHIIEGLEVFGKGMFTRNCNAILIAWEARNQVVVALAEKLQLPFRHNGVCQATRAQREVADVFTVCEIMCVWKTRDGCSPKFRGLFKTGRGWRNSLQICRLPLPTL